MLTRTQRERIDKQRRKLNVSQVDLARAIGVDTGQLSRFLHADGSLAWEHIEAMVASLDGKITRKVKITFKK